MAGDKVHISTETKSNYFNDDMDLTFLRFSLQLDRHSLSFVFYIPWSIDKLVVYLDHQANSVPVQVNGINWWPVLPNNNNPTSVHGLPQSWGLSTEPFGLQHISTLEA